MARKVLLGLLAQIQTARRAMSPLLQDHSTCVSLAQSIFSEWSDTVQLASPLVMVPHQALLASSSRSTRVQYPEPARGDYNLPT